MGNPNPTLRLRLIHPSSTLQNANIAKDLTLNGNPKPSPCKEERPHTFAPDPYLLTQIQKDSGSITSEASITNYKNLYHTPQTHKPFPNYSSHITSSLNSSGARIAIDLTRKTPNFRQIPYAHPQNPKPTDSRSTTYEPAIQKTSSQTHRANWSAYLYFRDGDSALSSQHSKRHSWTEPPKWE